MRKRLAEASLEILAGIFLSLAGAATSWSGYQAALWDGIQAEDYSSATALRLKAGLAAGEAGQLRIMDGDLFMQWLDAHAEGREKLQEFYRHRFRPEFMPAFNAWIASNPIANRNAYASPFEQPEYRLALQEESARLDRDGANTFRKGQEANLHSDNYVLNTVVFGMVMFFAGMSQQFKSRHVKKALLIISGLMALIGIYNLITFPPAP